MCFMVVSSIDILKYKKKAKSVGAQAGCFSGRRCGRRAALGGRHAGLSASHVPARLRAPRPAVIGDLQGFQAGGVQSGNPPSLLLNQP